MMPNPWLDFKIIEGENILVVDKENTAWLERCRRLNGDSRIVFEDNPVPYVGNPKTAKVVLLALNPGHNAGAFADECHNDPKLRNTAEKNLRHEPLQYPFYVFDPRFCGSGGHIYWQQKLRHIIYKIGMAQTAKTVCCIQFFPYHSKSANKRAMNSKKRGYLPSQQYNFELVRNAIADNKRIFIMRGETNWYEAVPELRKYKNKRVAKVPRNGNISETQCDEIASICED